MDGPHDSWDELDALVAGIRESNEDWRTMSDTLQQQLGNFRATTEQIEEHFTELGVYESLLMLSSRALNDAARVHVARLHYGLMRSAALVWYAVEDPRSELGGASPGSSYTIEVRIGPRYLLGVERDASGSGDQRLSVLIAGEKQLVATLPTTPDKFRSALLRAFAQPQYSGPPRDTEPTDSHPGGATGADESAGTDETSTTTAPPEPETAQAATRTTSPRRARSGRKAASKPTAPATARKEPEAAPPVTADGA